VSICALKNIVEIEGMGGSSIDQGREYRRVRAATRYDRSSSGIVSD